MVKLGLLGAGNMGKNHLRNLDLLKEVEVSFIYDIDQKSGNELATQYGVRFSVDLEADLKLVDGVIIATPTFTHANYITKVSDYVSNIFVEKPLTDTLESSEKIVSLAQERKLSIQVGFIERYNPTVIALRKVLKNSKNIINIDFLRTNKVSSRITDVDVVTDLMIHDIDLALHISGEVEKVEAHGYFKEGMIEYARAILTHVNGTYSNILASRITEKRIRQISATCDHMYIDGNLLSKELRVNKQTVEQYIEDVSISSKEETIDVRPQEALLLELLDFIELCKNGEPQVPNQIDGLEAMKIASKVQSIISTNR